MSRTKGSGWGGGTMLYQVCPKCGRKKCLYDPIPDCYGYHDFKCTWCKERFNSDTLAKTASPEIYKRWQEEGKGKIIIKKKFLELIKWKRDLKPLSELTENSDIVSDIDSCLEMLKKCKDLLTEIDGDGNLINENDYLTYLELLESEKYEELVKYKLV